MFFNVISKRNKYKNNNKKEKQNKIMKRRESCGKKIDRMKFDLKDVKNR